MANEPQKWAGLLGSGADVNTIPEETPAGTGAASMKSIFPPITQVPLSAGGIAPDRADFNGLFKLLGDNIYYQQQGGVYSYSAAIDYAKGSQVKHNDKIYVAIQPNGPATVEKEPGEEPEFWQEVVLSNTGIIATGTTTARSLENRFADVVNVKDFGAVGDGVTDDTNAIQSASEKGAIFLPKGEYLVSSDYVPNVNIYGEGTITKSNAAIKTGGVRVDYNPARENMICSPKMYQRDAIGIAYPLPRGFINHSYNSVFAMGSGLNDTSKTIRYNTVFGTGCGSSPIVWGYNDAFGSDAMIYAGYANRNCVIGSESLAWGGAPNQQWLRDYYHDWWRLKEGEDPETHKVPGDEGWGTEEGGLETLFPGIGTRINEYSDYATTENGLLGNTTCGRDALNHAVKGSYNVAVGYRSLAQAFESQNNVAVGVDALGNAVFSVNNVAIGRKAGNCSLDSEGNVFVGYGAGEKVRGGTGNLILGYFAAQNVESANNAIVIGHNAGKNVENRNLDNTLFIGTGSQMPLISGDLANQTAGINIPKGKIRNRFHVRYTDSGSTNNAAYSGMTIEGFSASFLTLEANSSGIGGIAFADPDNAFVGGIFYSHATDKLVFKLNDENKILIENTGDIIPNGTNNIKLGRSNHKWASVCSTSYLSGANNIDCAIDSMGAGYIRYANGLQICYGSANCSQGGTSNNLPMPFKNNSYTLTATYTGTINNVSISVARTAMNTFTLYQSYSADMLTADYIAIGLWK